MSKKISYTLLTLLFAFAVYAALVIGEGWDETYELLRGKSTINYLFSLGMVDNYIPYRERNSNLYFSLLYFVSQIFPTHYKIEVSHLVNLFFSILTVFGIRKICVLFFNKDVGNISFLILFSFPIFFGHMAFNSKNTIIAFSHVWILYLIFKYLKNQNIEKKVNKYIIYISLLLALATGIQLVFIGSLVPVFIFLIFDIFIFKKLITKNFSIKKLFYDILKCFCYFYILLIIFWIDTHSNIILRPFTFILEMFSNDYWLGWPYNLVNGEYFFSNEVPKNYIISNLFFKSPEYIFFCYIIFFYLFIKFPTFFKKEFKFFNYKLILFLFILIYVNILIFIVPFPIYDGMRLFLWIIPYYCIIPSLTIYYILKNYNKILSKIFGIVILTSVIYFLFTFIIITPYQYTYLNFFAGKKEERYKKFENDYWGASIKKLISKSSFDKTKLLSLSYCGLNPDVLKKYLKQNGYNYLSFNTEKDSDLVILTNRSTSMNKNGNKIITNCFDKFKGDNIYEVKANGIVLSAIRKNSNNSSK